MNLLRWFQTCVLAAFVGLAAFAGYHVLREREAADIYRQRLADVSRDYESLRQTYNEAVARTAVTELLVEDGRLCVNIRTAEGIDRSIDTPFDPSKEIYVDYVVLDGRLWIRRIFDQDTPPGKGLVIDPHRAEVDWADPRLKQGNAVYRALSEGRWIVTVTGDGSLGLMKTDPAEDVPLSPPPPVRDYPQINQTPHGAARFSGPANPPSYFVALSGSPAASGSGPPA